ncbi:ribosome maturation factor RimP [Helicobacter apodemus]|uniref:Ribosome maturation factor RimP n=1 Tax=Helicobacter apodemus TaxID=135569 RepID=A0A2U8FDM4_9HELI|nr:ribosome maturation factor RimP [Helicobacter apodemus]AWI34226.1 ribosome maturation factor RimP [Helicobacter apodemus]
MISSDLEAKISILIQSLGCELYDMAIINENNHKILRVYISKKPSVSLEECQEVSLALSPLLDVEMPNFENYFLEVSSPGIERILKTLTHFQGAIGELVKVKMLDKREFKGKLVEVYEDSIKLESGQSIPIEAIKKAQTYFLW